VFADIISVHGVLVEAAGHKTEVLAELVALAASLRVKSP
jgi:hypothetical protein